MEIIFFSYRLALRLVPKFLDDTARNARNFVKKEDNRMHSNQTMS